MAEIDPALDVGPAAESAAPVRRLVPGMTSQPRTLWGDAWRRFRRHKLAMVGSAVLILLIVITAVGPLLYRVDKEDLDFTAVQSPDFVSRVLQTLTTGTTSDGMGITLTHPMGTDDLGRDIFARVLYGGRISLLVGFVAMLIAVTLGSLIGALAGFFGGIIDQILMRITDLFLSLPVLPLLLVTIYLFREQTTRTLGPVLGIFVIVVVMIGALAWMSTARIVRASFMSLKEKEFVEAATALGVSRGSIMFRHILPNVLSPIIVAATLEVGNAIIAESTLSFLGVGFPPDTPTWGRLVTDYYQSLQVAPYMAIWPGLMIFFSVLSINFIGDGLRDALDPRSRL